MLWLGLYLPRLPLEVFTRGSADNAPLAVSHGQGRRQRLLVCNPPARRLGLRPGMRLSAAYALAGGLRARPQDEQAETAALERLAAWIGQFTSTVSLAPPQGILLEVGGSLLLFGGLDSLLEQIRDGLAKLGYHACLAVAPTPLAATLFARAGREPRITEKRELAAMLARLSIQYLDLSTDALATLEGMGIRAIGDCLRLPRDGLARRLGPALLDVLDRALGQAPDPRLPYRPPSRFNSRLSLPVEVDTSAALLFAIQRLILELTGTLQAQGGGVQTVALRLFHPSRRTTPIVLGLATPSRDPQHLLGLMRERLARVRLPEPVREIGLTVKEILPLTPQNLAFFATPDRGKRDWTTLLERLRARLGMDAVHGVCPVPERRPERAWRFCPPGEAETVPGFGPRPLWLLAEPLPLTVVDGRPRLQGVLTVEHDRERIESGWWDGHDMARDYFIAHDPHGARFWIFHELTAMRRWFLHGIFG